MSVDHEETFLDPIREERFQETIKKHQSNVAMGKAMVAEALKEAAEEENSDNIFTRLFKVLAAPTNALISAAKSIATSPRRLASIGPSKEDVEKQKSECQKALTDATNAVRSEEAEKQIERVRSNSYERKEKGLCRVGVG